MFTQSAVHSGGKGQGGKELWMEQCTKYRAVFHEDWSNIFYYQSVLYSIDL